MRTFLVVVAAFAQVPGLNLILPTYRNDFSPSGQFQAGRATYYGPNPNYPSGNEPGYRKLDVGVACSAGSGDPRWAAILSKGVKQNPLDPENVWPITPTVAVSEAAWGKSLCWQKVTLRSKVDSSKIITATIVDLCPASGCLWSKSERAFNVDIYGIDAFQLLGGDEKGGKLDLEIMWPAGFLPKNSATKNLFQISLLIVTTSVHFLN